jgi:glycosyltransferase involved in cell wall biosynthesis
VEGLIGPVPTAVVAYPGGDQFRPAMTPAQIAVRARQPGPLRVLFVGNLIPRKELHTLLAGLALVPRESWQLEVVGSLTVDPAYVEAMRGQIARAGLTQQVTLSGSLSDAEMAVCLARSHLLAVPSSYEGFGIVYMEGMGFGLPAIASLAGGAREIITQGQNGFLVSPGDSTTVAQHLHELSRNRERLVDMSLAAYARYAAHPTWAGSTAQIRAFLHSLDGAQCRPSQPIPSPVTSLPKKV